MRYLIFFFALFFASTSFANLNEGEQFLVHGLKVSEIDETSDLARNKAIDSAQKTAFKILLKRIYNIDVVEDIDIDKISSLVSAIELNDETITNKSYAALANVQFNEEFTRFYIKNNYLNQNAKAPRILIIPLYDENGFVKLWQRGNSWLNVWNSMPKDDLINLRVPIGDFTDINNFNSLSLENIDSDTAAALAKQYGVDRIVVAELEKRYSPLSQQTNILTNLFELGNFNNSTNIDNYKMQEGDIESEIMGKLANNIIENFNSAWIKHANQETDKQQSQEFIVIISDIIDLQRMDKLLRDMKIVDNYKLVSLSAKYAHYSIDFNQEVLIAIEKLKGYNFDVIQNNEGILILQER